MKLAQYLPGGWIMTGLHQRLPVVVDGGSEDLRLIHVRQCQQVKTLLPRPTVCVVAAGGGHPERWVRLLHRLRQDPDALIIEACAGEIDCLSGPSLLDDRCALSQV